MVSRLSAFSGDSLGHFSFCTTWRSPSPNIDTEVVVVLRFVVLRPVGWAPMGAVDDRLASWGLVTNCRYSILAVARYSIRPPSHFLRHDWSVW